MQTPMDNKMPLSITLTAEEWNSVLEILSDGRFRIASPLIQKIIDQAQKAQNQEATAQAQGGLHTRLQPVS